MLSVVTVGASAFSSHTLPAPARAAAVTSHRLPALHAAFSADAACFAAHGGHAAVHGLTLESVLGQPVSWDRANWAIRPTAVQRSSHRSGLLSARRVLQQARSQVVQRFSPKSVTILGAVVNVLLSVFKVAVGSLAGSASLIADGAHSFSDLLSDALCWVAIKLGARPADASHPFGYGKYESLCTLGISAILFSTGVAMCVASGGALVAALKAAAAGVGVPAMARAAPDMAALAVAVASVLSKEALFGITHAVGERCRSSSLVANAYHHRSDALSSLVAIVGICGVMFGCSWLDPLAATAVGLMVTHMAIEVGGGAIGALVDAAPEEDLVGEISSALDAAVAASPVLSGHRDLQVRRTPSAVHVEAVVRVGQSRLTTAALAAATRETRRRLLEALPAGSRIVISIDDEAGSAPVHKHPWWVDDDDDELRTVTQAILANGQDQQRAQWPPAAFSLGSLDQHVAKYGV